MASVGSTQDAGSHIYPHCALVYRKPFTLTVARLAFFKPCQHLYGFMWVQFYTQWYVQGVFVAYSGFLWLPMGPSGSPVA